MIYAFKIPSNITEISINYRLKTQLLSFCLSKCMVFNTYSFCHYTKIKFQIPLVFVVGRPIQHNLSYIRTGRIETLIIIFRGFCRVTDED